MWLYFNICTTLFPNGAFWSPGTPTYQFEGDTLWPITVLNENQGRRSPRCCGKVLFCLSFPKSYTFHRALLPRLLPHSSTPPQPSHFSPWDFLGLVFSFSYLILNYEKAETVSSPSLLTASTAINHQSQHAFWNWWLGAFPAWSRAVPNTSLPCPHFCPLTSLSPVLPGFSWS